MLQFEEGAIPVERRPALQQTRPDLEPFQTVVIAPSLVDLDAVQVELLLVPAADDIQPRASMRHVVDGGDRLGTKGGGDQRHVHGREDGDLLRQRAQGGAVGQGFVGFAVDVGLALIAAPLRHGQDELDASVIGDAGHRHDVVPIGLPAFGRQAQGQPAVAVGAEDAKFEAVGTEQGVAGSGVVHGGPR